MKTKARLSAELSIVEDILQHRHRTHCQRLEIFLVLETTNLSVEKESDLQIFHIIIVKMSSFQQKNASHMKTQKLWPYIGNKINQ